MFISCLLTVSLIGGMSSNLRFSSVSFMLWAVSYKLQLSIYAISSSRYPYYNNDSDII